MRRGNALGIFDFLKSPDTSRSSAETDTVRRIVDSLDKLMPPWLLRLQQALVDLFCAAALLGLAWLMWEKAGQMASYGDVTAQLKLPLGPFVHLMSVLCGITALVHLMLLLRPASHHHLGVDDGPA